jgi:hypothetical protein
MTLKETKKEMDKTLRKVPVGIWCRFKGRCGERNINLTQGFIEAVNLWLEKN